MLFAMRYNKVMEVKQMNYRDKYCDWMEHLDEDNPLRDELSNIGDDEIKERFYRDLSFGTAGLRGKVGAGSDRMNVFTVGRATQGIAEYIRNQGEEAMARGVVIAHDPRHFSREFCMLAAGVLAGNGIRAYIFPDLRPTPQLSFMIRRLGTIAGINITASHNPKEYNGFKVYWEDGCQVSSDIAADMTRYIKGVDMWSGIFAMDYKEGLSDGSIVILGDEYDREYLDKVESLAIRDDDQLDLGIPIVYSPLNGCGNIPFRKMLEERGFTSWTIVEEQADPDPDFTTVGYPNPEDPAAFRLCEKYGHETGAELLMATDPDADRFAAEILNDKGEYVPLNGNQTGYLLVNYILEGRNAAGTLPAKGAMVKSIVTSTLSTRMAEAYGVAMFETLTGFKNICGKIPYLHENGYTYLLGYEESVGYAACEDIRDKDGISAGMLLAEAAAYYRRQGKSLWDVLEEIYEKYGYFAEDEPNIILEGIAGSERIGRMMKWFRENVPSVIAGARAVKIIDYLDGYDGLEPHNALRVFLDNGSWFAVRPSGTEPKIKFYFYSCQNSRERALQVNRKVREDVMALINAVE